MCMRNEDRLDSETGLIAHHLALRALTAVEEEQIALSLNGQSTHIARHSGASCGSSEKGQADHR